ncbi:MAG TPA: M56 and DUF3738 domain-containing protein [Candidatus Angelobacter sp.]|nr:M56 and DUF3738 domain-containing protein [Candidatus Angelobacter sp.]
MTPNHFTIYVAATGNHLWQSTLFAITVWLLTLLLRKNRARARYWLWMAASLKFLLPFSLLVGLGGRLASPRPSAAKQTGFYWVMEQVSQPFTRQVPLLIPPTVPMPVSPSRMDLLPMILAAAWLCGLVVVLLAWCLRRRRISAVMRDAAPLREARELEALRRLESKAGIRHTLEMRLSRASLEPGIFGIFRPVLLWPQGISERLGDEHLEAILAHELWHVRRRDNLAAATHMLVEAIFWFHPLVWWLGARLVEERELACDEGVLALGSRPQVYAESILKTCEFCVEAPLACVSGVTGADLKKRVVRIMTQNLAEKLSLGRKLVLAVMGAVAIAGPMVFGLLHAPQVQAQSPQTAGVSSPSFDVASIKPNKSDTAMDKILFTPSGFSAEHIAVHEFIRIAYDVQETQIVAEPGWLNSEKYDVEARVTLALEGQHYSPSDRKLALQQLLADRFNLKLHRETRELPVYELVIAENGSKFHESRPGDTYTNGTKRQDGQPIGQGIWMLGRGNLVSQGQPIESLISVLSRQLDRPILDKTGLKGQYDYTLQWTPEDSPTDGGKPGAQPAPESSGPSIFAAIQEKLGLKLEPKKGPMQVLVIDHIEEPSEN